MDAGGGTGCLPPHSSSQLVPLRLAAAILLLLGLGPAVAFGVVGTTNTWAAGFVRWIVTAPLVAVVASLGLALVLGDQVDALLERGRKVLLAPSPKVFCLLVALVVASLTAVFAWYLFAARPFVGDELSQRFEAHLLLHGRLSVVSEPLQAFFDSNQTVNLEGRWFSEFPIGWPTLLAAGGLVRAAWLVNPLLAAWTSYNLYRLVARIADEATARVTSLLFALSPFVLIMSATGMDQTSALAFVVFALAALPDWTGSPDATVSRRAAIRVGVGMGCAATLRPYDAALAALAIGAFQLNALRAAAPPLRRVQLRALAWQVAAGLVPVAWLLFANWRTTGNALLFGYDALNGAAHRPGFHVDPYGRNFTPALGVLQTAFYLLHVNVALFEWPFPAVVIFALALACARRATQWDYLLLGLLSAVLVGYMAYWHQGDLFGPRLLYTAVPAFLFFSARMPGAVASRLRRPVLRRAALVLIPVCVCTAWMPFQGPGRFAGVWARVAATRASDIYRDVDVAREIDEAGLQNALVFVREPLREQLSARLRVLGEPALMAEQVAANVDACALEEALDADDSVPTGSAHDRLERVVRRAEQAGVAQPLPGLIGSFSLALVGGQPSTPACAQRVALDRTGTMPLELFLPLDDFDSTGRLGGRVVFARDFGARNELLRARFSGRAWFRYRPRQGPGDTAAVFVPYE